MNELRWCRNCVHFSYTGDFKGNCQKHPWDHDKYSQDAEAETCPHYRDKAARYATAAKET